MPRMALTSTVIWRRTSREVLIKLPFLVYYQLAD
jgi:hypothetical protein